MLNIRKLVSNIIITKGTSIPGSFVSADCLDCFPKNLKSESAENTFDPRFVRKSNLSQNPTSYNGLFKAAPRRNWRNQRNDKWIGNYGK